MKSYLVVFLCLINLISNLQITTNKANSQQTTLKNAVLTIYADDTLEKVVLNGKELPLDHNIIQNGLIKPIIFYLGDIPKDSEVSMSVSINKYTIRPGLKASVSYSDGTNNKFAFTNEDTECTKGTIRVHKKCVYCNDEKDGQKPVWIWSKEIPSPMEVECKLKIK